MTPTHALLYAAAMLAGTALAICGLPVIVGCAVVVWCVIREERRKDKE